MCKIPKLSDLPNPLKQNKAMFSAICFKYTFCLFYSIMWPKTCQNQHFRLEPNDLKKKTPKTTRKVVLKNILMFSATSLFNIHTSKPGIVSALI